MRTILLLFSIVIFLQNAFSQRGRVESPLFKTGTKPGLFKALDLDGLEQNLDDSAGKIIVLNFWFVDCSPCRKEIPELNHLVDSFKKTSKVLFYGIALDDTVRLKSFLRKMPFRYTVLANARWIAAKYNISFFPTHVVLDQEGKVYYYAIGLGKNTVNMLRRSIEQLLLREI